MAPIISGQAMGTDYETRRCDRCGLIWQQVANSATVEDPAMHGSCPRCHTLDTQD